jgi:hypothetical protein
MPRPLGRGRLAHATWQWKSRVLLWIMSSFTWNSLTNIDKRWKRTDALNRQSVESIASRLETTGDLDRAAIDQLLKRYPARKVKASTASPRKDNGVLE